MGYVAKVQIAKAFEFNLIKFQLNQIANATGPILNSTQTWLKVGYLDRLFSPDHFSYIIC